MSNIVRAAAFVVVIGFAAASVALVESFRSPASQIVLTTSFFSSSSQNEGPDPIDEFLMELIERDEEGGPARTDCGGSPNPSGSLPRADVGSGRSRQEESIPPISISSD